MFERLFQDPQSPYDNADGSWTLQIHAPLPEQVRVGHYDPSGRELIDATVPRAEYLGRIQEACAKHGDALLVRFYDHGGDTFDAAILDQLPAIRRLSIGSMQHVLNPEAVKRLPCLRALTFGAVGKQRIDILDTLGVQRLEEFTLAETPTPLIDLAPLGQSRSLRRLRLLARGRNTEAIGECASLVELALHASDKFDLGFITRLQGLEVLKFSLGKVASIAAIGPLPALSDLSFDEVHMLEELGDLQRFPRLRRLQISYQKRLKRIKVGPANAALEHIKVSGLDEIEGFYGLPALESLWMFDTKFAPDWSRLPPTLTHFLLMPKALGARAKHAAEVRAHGLIPEPHPEATFFYK